METEQLNLPGELHEKGTFNGINICYFSQSKLYATCYYSLDFLNFSCTLFHLLAQF